MVRRADLPQLHGVSSVRRVPPCGRAARRRGGVVSGADAATFFEPLIEYACPPGGMIIDPTAGSGSALAVAKVTGRYSVGIEADGAMCEIAARRLAQDTLFGGVA
jgi:hypothetical protein